MNDAAGSATRLPTSGLASLESYLVEFPNELDLRGQVELRADSGLTLLYGRNGSGKTSVLRAIKSSLSGIASATSDGPVCRLVVGLADWDSEDPDFLDQPKFRGCRSFIRKLSQSVLQHQGFEQDWTLADYRAEFEKWARELADIDPQLSELPAFWMSSATEQRSGTPTHDAYEECVRFASKSRTRLLAIPLIEDAIFMSFVGSMEEGSERFRKTIRLIRLVLQDPVLVVSPTGTPNSGLWTASIAARNPGPDSELGTILEEQDQALSDYMSEHADGIFAEIEAFEADALPTALLRKNEITLAWGTKYIALSTTSNLVIDELPFSVVDSNSVRSIEETLNSELSGNFPTLAAAWMESQQAAASGSDGREDDNDDSDSDDDGHDGSTDDDVEESLDTSIAIGPFGPIDLEDSDIQENIEHIQKFQDNLRAALSLLGDCDIRISSGAFLTLCTSLEDFKRGRFIDVSFYEFPDLQGPFSVSFEQLSDGQQKLINLAFAAVAASFDESGKTAILIGDEIDNGIHVRAVIALYRMLGGLPLSCVCSTHSIDAVANSVGRRVHLTREDDSGIHIEGFDINDAKSAAERLGVTTSSLVAFVRVIVIVEGEHDRIVFESLFNAQDTGVGNEVLVLPIRGANNLMTSLEAQFLDYTDAKVLVVLDNVRQLTIAKLLEVANSRHASDPRQLRNALVAARAACQSHEERIIGDVIIKRFDRGDLSRFSPFGLSKRDVIEYLNPNDFELGDWEELRKEHDALPASDPMARASFKDYLRAKRGISISNDDVKRASRNLGNLHPDLVALIENVNQQLGRRSIELEFGFRET